MERNIEPILKKFEVKTFGNNKNIEKALELVKDDEEILYISPTNLSVKNSNTGKEEMLPGVCILTNKRFIFQNKILFQTKTETIDIQNIDNVSSEGNSMTGGKITINSLSKSYSMLVSYKSSIMKLIVDTFEQAMNNAKKNNSQSTVSNSSSADEIKKYKDLLDSGAITQEEFDAKKKQLLGL